jgi:hypothetical protein
VFSLLNHYRGLGAMKLSPTERLALEMAVHEESERRARVELRLRLVEIRDDGVIHALLPVTDGVAGRRCRRALKWNLLEESGGT